MKVIEEPDATWSALITCERCKTVYEADQDDLQVDNFKTSGYFFTGTAVLDTRFFVECPTDQALFLVPDDDIPIILRDRVRAVVNESRQPYEERV